MRDIALIGRMGSGKDAIAAHLCSAHGYTRIAFADGVRDMALEIDPLIAGRTVINMFGDAGNEVFRLSEIVGEAGWDAAKREHPEVRRILQHCGMTVRRLQSYLWLNAGLAKLDALDFADAVFTDVRFTNEADALRDRGFAVVRVVRASAQAAEGAQHVSETELDDYPVDDVVYNDGSLADLAQSVDAMLAGA